MLYQIDTIDKIDIIYINNIIRNYMENEWRIADKIQQLYCELHIIKSQSKPFTLYRISEIFKNIGIKVNRCVTQHYTDEDKRMVRIKTNGGQQSVAFVTYTGLCRILCKSRQKIPDELLNICNVKQIKYNCIEYDTILNIITAFTGEEYILQHQVLSYRIDLYFPKYRIAIECDESHHLQKNNSENDKIRESRIIEELDCKFIRYTPYDKDFNIFCVINQIYNQIKSHKE
jgi:very-short-patch-repair endonuclease